MTHTGSGRYFGAAWQLRPDHGSRVAGRGPTSTARAGGDGLDGVVAVLLLWLTAHSRIQVVSSSLHSFIDDPFKAMGSSRRKSNHPQIPTGRRRQDHDLHNSRCRWMVRDLDDGPEGRSITFRDQMAALLYPAASGQRYELQRLEEMRGTQSAPPQAWRARYISHRAGAGCDLRGQMPPTAAYAAAGLSGPTPAITHGLRPGQPDRADAGCSSISHQNNGRFWGRVKGPQIEAAVCRKGRTARAWKQRERSTRTARP